MHQENLNGGWGAENHATMVSAQWLTG